MNRIEKKFKELKARKKKAFIAFITAGYPNLKITEKLVLEFAKFGVDIIELGVPFSDPLADGPMIQEASQAALRHKINLNDILRMVKTLRKATEVPICLMTYYNPVFCFGEKKFAQQAKAAGVDGIIIPDLPAEEGRLLLKSARDVDLDIIFFLAPTSSKERIKFISKLSRGFIYYVSLTGTTGARKNLSADIAQNVRLIKKYTKTPVCVGFGISSPEHVRQVDRIADGAIIGSAIVKKIKENIGRQDLIKKVNDFVKCLKGS